MNNIRLDLSYDGTNYSGWQSQTNSNTIEDILKSSLEKQNINFNHLMASGRTDAGVHALNQVVTFNSDTTIPPDRILFALNRVLPEDIRIKSSSLVPDNFNARYSAIGKEYDYYVNFNSIASPFESRYSWHFPYSIDKKKVQYAANFLKGNHDYINFRKTGSSVKTTVRNVYNIDPIFLDNNFLKLHYSGNGFLYNMVRILTGTIIEFANNRISTDRLHQVFDKVDRNLAGITAPAPGLFLNKVIYSE